jgi:hypothetical protein
VALEYDRSPKARKFPQLGKSPAGGCMMRLSDETLLDLRILCSHPSSKDAPGPQRLYAMLEGLLPAFLISVIFQG